jgi:RNA polymerase sigma factor (TIGR02999 family)
MRGVTQLIASARGGDRDALHRLFDVLYPELRRIAHRRLVRHPRDGLVDTTALVNECFLKFMQRDGLAPSDRVHFLAYSATVMRSIVVDAARAASAERRGGDVRHVTLGSELIGSIAQGAEEVLDIHAALEELARLDARLAQVVEMRYFAGMNDAEIGEALGLADRTVRRDWEKARLTLAVILKR